MTPEAIELIFIREFSKGNLQIGHSPQRTDRRERIRQAIFASGQSSWKFYGTTWNYAEAFQACFGEGLDRRATMRDVSQMSPNEFEP